MTFSIFVKTLTGKLPKYEGPVIADTYISEIDIPNQGKIPFKLLETSGNEDYGPMFNCWITDSDGFLLIFAFNDKESFQFIKNRYKQIKNLKKDKNPIIVVGNKCDLESERKIDSQEAIEYAKEIGAKYYETSAKTDANGNCKVIFEECARMIYSQILEKKEIKSKKCLIF